MQQGGNQIKTLQLLHKSMIGGQILFVIVAFTLMVLKRLPVVEGDKNIIFRIAGFVAAGIWIIGFFLFNKIIRSIAERQLTFNERFSNFRKTSVAQWALLEIAVLVTLVCFILTGNNELFGIGFILVAAFSRLYPSKEKIISSLSLSQQDIGILEKTP